jgi:two-component system response regulator HydG
MDTQMPEQANASILIVDDEPEFCRFIEDFLSPSGYTVRSVHDGAGALECLAEGFDLVLCDNQMKGISGLELIARLNERDPSVPIVMVTAFGSIDQAVDAMRRGAYDYLTKPVSIDELRAHVKRALEARRLRTEVKRLRRLAIDRTSLDGLIAKSDAMVRIVETIHQLERSTSSVLVRGESGTGKELVARALHAHSPVASGPFVAVNCAAIPDQLLESELFGHVRGAFTDARADKIGLFQEADGGTLFLDEIGEMAPALQAKLLRVLEDGAIRRVGATTSDVVSVRVISATNRDLEPNGDGGFRADLYYRLNVVEIFIPPLRERPEDIPALVQHLLAGLGTEQGSRRVSPQALAALLAQPWPGNVRQLRNALEHAAALTRDEVIDVGDLPDSVRRTDAAAIGAERIDALSPDLSLQQLEDQYLEHVLNHTNGNRTAAAEILGIDRKTLYSRLRKRSS